MTDDLRDYFGCLGTMVAAAVAMVLFAVALAGLAACGGTRPPQDVTTTTSPAAATSAGPSPTADDVACAQSLVVAMRTGLNHSTINSANLTAAQQQAEYGLTTCEPVITAHGEGLDAAVWNLTAQAGFPRSRWDQ